MRTALKIDNCFVCNKLLDGNMWYHHHLCSIDLDNTIVHKIPDYLPVEQEEEYLKLLYKRRINEIIRRPY